MISHSGVSGSLTGLDTVGFVFPIRPDFDTVGARVVGGVVTGTTGTGGEGPFAVDLRRARFAHELPGGGFVNLGLGMAWVEASIPKRVDLRWNERSPR